MNSRLTHIVLAGATLGMLVPGCAGPGRFTPPPPIPDDRRDIPRPEEQEISVEADYVEQQVFRQVEEVLDISRGVRWLTGNRKEAMNVDAFDNVPGSSWFTNRIHLGGMTPAAVRRGPDTVDGPDMTSWTIVRAKSQGVTPGFHIEDGRGDRYLVKFDPPDYPELITAAEVISTKLFYAAGYNTPENHVVYFDPSILRLGENVRFVDDKGKRRAMTESDLQVLLGKVTMSQDGTIRAVASKYIDGVPVGPFKYKGTRSDDPNDIYPHEHRRELRGLRVIAAWLGHFDTKANNSLDSYVTVDGRSFVRHYLIDFGSTLGAGAEGPVLRFRGHENEFDPNAIVVNTLSLGIHIRPYEKLERTRFRSVGLWRSELFNPEKYKFQAPNPAFENMTDRDAFWATKIVTSFTDAHIDAAVAAGRYTDPEAAAWVSRVIKERRDIVGRYWFSQINPLDNFSLSTSGGVVDLTFDDLAVAAGLESAGDTRYRLTLERGEQIVMKSHDFSGTTVTLDGVEERGGDRWRCSIRTRRGEGDWSAPVHIYLDGGLSVLGVRR